jgi:predicted amidophosphoribosyltransferase
VLLVDDVVTTGATLLAVAAVLRAAGVEEITAQVGARAPLSADATLERPAGRS